MSTILKLWFMRLKEPWFALPEVEQNELMGKVSHSLSQLGGKLHLRSASVWSSEKWMTWGLEEYPNLAAVQAHTMTLYGLNWFRYIHSWSILGTKTWPEGEIIVEKAPLYKVALFRMKDAWLALPKAEQEAWNAKMDESYEKTGTRVILFAGTSWCDEQWQAFVIEACPSLEAVQERAAWMEESGWYKYARAISTLGVRWPIE